MKLCGWLVSLTLSLVSTTIQADTFADNFNTQSYSNQNGSHNWSSDWVESGDGGGANGGVTNGDIVITGGELRLRDDDRNITRAVNLSAYSTITLAFDYDEQDFDNSTDDWVEIQIRSGGSGSFTTLQRFAGNGVNTGSYSIDISSYNNALVEIRFQTSPDLGGSDALYIDNLLITATVAVACSALFPDAISSNNAAGSLNFSWNSRVIGSPDNILETTNLIDGSGGVSCNTVACSQSGSVVSAVSYSTFPGGANVAVGVFGSQTLAPGNYGNISANVFSTLTLSAGDYTVSGNLDIGFAANLVVSGSGTARIFVNGTVSFNSQTDINNPGNAEQLVIFSNGNIAMTSPTIANGFFYSNGTVFLGSSSSVSGAITARNVNLESPSTVTYEASALGNTDFGALCSAAPPSPIPIAEYHFDELAWNGTAGEVIDSTGNGLNGRAINSANTGDTTPDPARTGNPGTCRYADLNGGTQYVEVADNSQLDMPTALTVTVWIYPRSFPSSDLMTILSKDTNYEFHLNPSRQINWWWNSAGGATQQFNTTGPQLNLNTWYHIAIVYTNGDQRIYINGVERGTATFTGNLTTNNTPMLIGTDTGFIGNRNFNGAIDEVKIFNSALSASEIQAIYAETHPCAVTGPDHYVITVSPTAVTCEPLAVTVAGVDSGGNPVNIPAGTVLTMSTDVANDGWSNPGGAGAVYALAADAATVEFELRKLTPATLEIDVDSSSGATDDDGNRNDDTVIFSNAGLRFYADAVVDNIQTKIAGKPSNVASESQTITIKAVQSSPADPGVCEALVTNSSADIGFAYRCDIPGSCATANGALTVNSTPVNSDATTPYINVSIAFDGSGLGTFTFDYDDAGFITLLADADLPVPGSGGGTANVQGGSNSFLVKPAGLCVEVEATEIDHGCTEVDASCSAFKSVDTDFTLRVSGRGWESSGEMNTSFCDNAITGNFQLANIGLGSRVIEPSSGDDATLSVTSTTISGAAGYVDQDLSVDEVGIFTFTATAPAYFGQIIGEPVIPPEAYTSTSANIGRFFPHHYVVETTSIIPAIDPFTYLGQPFIAAFDIRAVDSAGNTTVNYRDDGGDNNFIKLDINTQISYGAVDSVPTYLTTRLSPVAVLPPPVWTWGDGTISAVNIPLVLARDAVVEAPLTVDIGLVLTDSDGVTLDPVVFDLDTEIPVANDRQRIGSASEFRYGRAFIPPVYGPEIPVNPAVTTPIPFVAQYWNGTSFITSADDSVSRYDSWVQLACVDGSVACSDVTFSPASAGADVINGVGDSNEPMRITRPGYPGDLQLQIDVDDWFQYDWTMPGTDEDPTTTITFGTYRGHDRIIYWREVH